MGSKQTSHRATPQRKKSYRRPRLVVYGDVRRLTAVKFGMMGDGGGKPSTKMSGSNA
jgi:hypothetical protein